MRKFVVDASTCLKWIFDENDSLIARNLQREFENNKVLLVAPNLWEYEITNALASAVRRKKISLNKSKAALKALLEARPEIMEITILLEKCLTNAQKYDLSAYDSAYVTLAIESEIPLISADDKLVSKINNHHIAVSLTDL